MKTPIAVLLLTLVIALPSLAHGIHRYENGLWFDGTRFVPRTVWSVDGVIRFDCAKPPDSVTDLKGAYVIPPFADAHHHAFGAGDPEQTIAKFLRDGVFYVKNPNNLPRLTAPFRAKVNRPESVDVVYANGGFTSTGGHPSQIYAQIAAHLGMRAEEMPGEAYFIVDDEADLDRVWKTFLATKPDFVKVYLEHSEGPSRGLDPKVVPFIVARAHAAGLSVSAHVASAADFRAALAARVDEITHLPLEKLAEADAREAARLRTRVVTTTISHRRVPDGIDAIHVHNLRLLRAAGVPLAIGTDNDPTSVAEAENLHRLGVFDDATLLGLWTGDTARAIFPKRRIGRLEEGYEASFLALEGNPLEDFRNVRRIALRVKQGHRLDITTPVTKPLATERLVPVVMSESADAAVRAYDRMRAEEASTYDTGERALNQLGYILLQHGRTDDAITVFLANVERFPASANVYDSLGEAYAKKGDKAAAIRNYEKSLELNPNNTNAVEMLRKLRE